MSKMKQILLLATAAFIAFSLSACSFEDGKVNDNADKTKATDQHTAQDNHTPPAGATAQNGGDTANGTNAGDGAMTTDNHMAGNGEEEDGGRLPDMVDDAKDDIEGGIDRVGDDIRDGLTDAKDDITGAGNNNNGAGVGSTDGAANGR